MRSLLVFGLLLCPLAVGCGEDSDVPEELRAPPQKAMTPETMDPSAPRGAAPAESPF
jgi:hypothetical protein